MTKTCGKSEVVILKDLYLTLLEINKQVNVLLSTIKPTVTRYGNHKEVESESDARRVILRFVSWECEFQFVLFVWVLKRFENKYCERKGIMQIGNA